MFSAMELRPHNSLTHSLLPQVKCLIVIRESSKCIREKLKMILFIITLPNLVEIGICHYRLKVI